MSLALGGLGAMSLPMPLAIWSLSRLFGVVELRSLLFALLLFAVLLIVAYLSNPSEASFRQFLTEQSFRQHISRLDVQDENHHERSDTYFALAKRRLSALTRKTVNCDDLSIPFHFSSRAGISVRTPKHIFRSFGVVTFAAIIPSDRHFCNAKSIDGSADFTGLSVSDLWFVGAFGKWWYGARLDSWWKDCFTLGKDEEGAPTGVLDMKSLDRPENRIDSSLLKSASHQLFALKQRSRDGAPHSSDRISRSSTPPPLPKSASLPLHSKRASVSISEQKQIGSHLHTQPLPSHPLITEPQQSRTTGSAVAVPTASTPLSRSPSASFDQSPVIAELLRQVGIVQLNVTDLRGQLVNFRQTAVETRQHLQKDLDAQRDRKKQDDSSRSELKTRTKNLEDAKRHAESTKREAEKKLKAAENKRLSATTRIEQLDREIRNLHQRMIDDGAQIVKSGIETSAMQAGITEEVTTKKKEIKIAEEVVAALSQRARELEEMIANETARLQKAREDAEMRKQDRSFFPLHVITPNINAWPPISGPTYEESSIEPEGLTVLESPVTSRSRPSSFHAAIKSGLDGGLPTLISKGYSIFDKDIASVSQLPLSGIYKTSFSPFAESTEAELQSTQALRDGIISPVSSSLIPSSLYQSLDIENSRNHRAPQLVMSKTDALSDRELNPRELQFDKGGPTVELIQGPGSPVSPTSPVGDEYDAFEVRSRPYSRVPYNMDTQRAQFNLIGSSHNITEAKEEQIIVSENTQVPAHARHVFSKVKTGLNPDAKVFSLPKDRGRHVLVHSSANALSSLGPAFEMRNEKVHTRNQLEDDSKIVKHKTTSSFSSPFFTSSRAFAPSREEREALNRALGGSKNTSLERLPSLSEVGSLPASPNLVHTVATPNQSYTSSHHVQTNVPNYSSLIGDGTARQSLWDVSTMLPTSKPHTNIFQPFADEDPFTVGQVSGDSRRRSTGDATEST